MSAAFILANFVIVIGHAVATGQRVYAKVTATGSPRNCDSRTVLPVWSTSAKSGTSSPTATPLFGSGFAGPVAPSTASSAS